jgi:hypothetical protein
VVIREHSQNRVQRRVREQVAAMTIGEDTNIAGAFDLIATTLSRWWIN